MNIFKNAFIKAIKIIRRNIVFFISYVLVLSTIIIIINTQFNISDEQVYYLLFISAFLGTILLKRLDNKERNKSQYRDYLLNELEKNKKSCNETTEDSIDIKDEKIDIIALMLKNNDEINEYFKISKNQAKAAFGLSVIACVCGLVALLFGVYCAIFLYNVEVSVISIISGAISEVIAATVFWVHNKSALQLNHYYNALHENEKFLSAVNMADKLSDDNREKIIMEIIRNQISVRDIEEK